MNAVRDVFSDENVMLVEAGVTLAQAQDAAHDVDRLLPLALASQGTAQIGGNLSTNAGGVNVLRYGNARDLCLGLEAVLPNGDIWHGLTRLRKDNTGYDLRNLLIGAEGTLGVITAAALKLSARPTGRATAMLAVPDPRAALNLLAIARDHVGEAVSSFELISKMGFDFLTQTLPDLRQPFDVAPNWCVLIELGLSRGQDPDAALAAIYQVSSDAGLVVDGVLAQSDSQRRALWDIRENIPTANRLIGSISSHDVSLPLGAIPDFIATAPDHVAKLGEFRINCFGHLGDGNLHYNVFPPLGSQKSDYADQSHHIQRCVHDLVHEMGGSVSAEHGVGRLKVGDVERYGDPTRLAAMRAIKAALDPTGIMNPGAVLR
jgi:FAD/FMN-containing dehydrogenase